MSNYTVFGDWLALCVDQCTCYGGEFGHEPGCGYEPVAKIAEIRAALDAAGIPVIDAAHIDRQRAFSEATFGPGRRTHGVVDHIRKELVEVLADPDDVKEWVDVVILALDGAWRTGASSQAIIDAIRAKQAKNESRAWPDWRTAEPGKAIEHVRT